MKVQLACTLVMSVLEQLVYSGLISGWSALVPVLKSEQIFSSGCNSSETQPCKRQIESLNLVYTVSTAAAPLFGVFCGLILDKFGGWTLRTSMICVESAGFFLLRYASAESSWILYVSLPLITIGGHGLCTANLKMCNLFSGRRSTVLSLFCGCISTSALTFLAVNKIYFSSFMSFPKLCLAFVFVSFVFHTNTFILTPKYQVDKEKTIDYFYGYKELDCLKEKSDRKSETKSSNENQINKESIHLTLKKPYFWSNAAHYCILSFLLSYFLGSFNSWVANKVEEGGEGTLVFVLNIAISTGVLVSPIAGYLLDYNRKKYEKFHSQKTANMMSSAVNYFICDASVVLLFAMSLVDNSSLQFATIFFNCVARAFLYSTNASFVSALFPARHFGFLYSLVSLLTGASLFLQYPLTLLVTRAFGSSYDAVYAVLLALSALCLLHPVFLLVLARNTREK